jgi:hypothetical protein
MTIGTTPMPYLTGRRFFITEQATTKRSIVKLNNYRTIKITESGIECSAKTEGQSKVRTKILDSSNNTKRIIVVRTQIHGYKIVEIELGEREQQRQRGEIRDVPRLLLFPRLLRVSRIQFLVLCLYVFYVICAHKNSTIGAILCAHKT